ncbi:uncharacterized protein [Dysidea avara]|uniref:uncharacterized protein n=1 Tax=Dysidea avara TaxID=196820 RepID=UPI0033247645
MKFNSTSVKPDSPNATLISKAGLLFEYCNNLTLSFVTVENSSGVGIQIYNTIGKIHISRSHFARNIILPNENTKFSGGGGVSIEFSLCQPGTNSNNCNETESKFASNAKYLIENSTFIQNIGSTMNLSNSTIFQNTHFTFGRGGGLSIYVKGNANHNTFAVTNCNFTENTALYGAGIFIKLQDTSNHNNFTIQDTNFKLNKVMPERFSSAGTCGGAVMLNYNMLNVNSKVLYNSVVFVNATFESNIAYVGGGVCFHSSKESDVIRSTNHLRFSDCYWHDNFATFGASLYLSTLNPVVSGQLIKPFLSNCTFVGNRVSGFGIKDSYKGGDVGNTEFSGGHHLGTGIMYLKAITVGFSHGMKIFNNRGSAIAAIGASVDLYPNAVLNFTNNQGYEGGALYFTDNSWISASPNVQILLINNSAASLGGAIYAQNSGYNDDLVSTDSCFVRYTDLTKSPDQWTNVSFQFVDNCAYTENGGDAIYTTTVAGCASNFTLSKVLLEWSGFKFNHNSNNNNCSQFIQTSATSFKKLTNKTSIIPGEVFSIPFEAQNDFGNVTSATFTIVSDDKNVKIPNPVVQTNGTTQVKTNQTGNFNLQFVSAGNIKYVDYITVSVENCTLGYHLYSGECVCSAEKYDGVFLCNSSGLEIIVQPNYWVGEINNKFFSTYECPLSYCTHNKHSSDTVKVKHDSNVTCKNRVGTLCGDCAPGYGLAIGGTLDCVKCNKSYFTAWIIYVITTYLPMTIMLLVLLVLNCNLAVGHIHSFIFFTQILPAIAVGTNHWNNYTGAMHVINTIYINIINIFEFKGDIIFQ